MKKIIFIITALSALFVSASLLAGHSFSATFQEQARFSIDGLPTSFSVGNPSDLGDNDVTDADGSATSTPLLSAPSSVPTNSAPPADADPNELEDLDEDDNSTRTSFLIGFGLAMICLVGVLYVYRNET